MERIKRTNKLISAVVAVGLAVAVMLVSLISLPNLNKAQAEKYPEGSPSELGFSINAKLYESLSASDLSDADWEGSLAKYNDYISGICLTGGSNINAPAIILHLTGETARNDNTAFYYRMQQNIGEVAPSEDWIQVADAVTTDSFAILFTDDIIGDQTTYFRKYFFFKTVITKVGDNGVSTKEELVNNQFVDVIRDSTATQSAYNIVSINATYVRGSTIPYPTEQPIWTTSDITFTITSRDNTLPNITHFYAIGNKPDGTPDWRPALKSLAPDGVNYNSVATIKQTYSGEVRFAASNEDGSVVLESASRKNIQIDKAVPEFGVAATKNNGTEIYTYGSGAGINSDDHWSSTDVTYTLVPADIGKCISGANYFYNKNDETESNGERRWVQINPIISGTTAVYSLVISESLTSLRFKGISNAGEISTNTTNYITNIDKESPSLKLYAEDARGTQIATNGYASDTITFSLSNQNLKTKAKVYFEYKIDGVSADYQPVPIENGSNQLVGRQPIVYATYHFRARSQSGLTNETVFVVSALDSKFILTMDKLDFATNVDGWANKIIEVVLNVPNILNENAEYKFYSVVLGDNTTQKELDATLIANSQFELNGIKYKKYRVKIDDSLDSKIMTFYAVNKALDKSATVRTQEIKLDLKAPDYTIKPWLYNSTTVMLADGDWANGKVIVKMTPTSNISGLKCYPLLGVGEGKVNGKEIVFKDGMFAFEVTKSGDYSFRITSGAGLSTEKTLRINIDTSLIEFNAIKASVNGKEIATDGSATVASDVLIEFMSNQQSHFDFYWQNYTGLSPVLGAYAKGAGDTYTIKPETNGATTKKYAFYLQSKAVDAYGNRYTSEVKTITITFDVKDFTILIHYDAATLASWQNRGILFAFSDAEGGTNIANYQFQMLIDGSAQWQNITLDNNYTYTFNGIERFYKGVSIGRSYLGGISFRAVNAAGHASAVVGIETAQKVKIDTTNTDPMFGLNINEGGTIMTVNNCDTVYAKTPIIYRNTNNSAQDIFATMAPITYYYLLWTGDTQPEVTAMKKLETNAEVPLGSASVTDTKYWIYAVNEVGSAKMAKYNFIIQRTKFEASFQGGAGGALGSSGIYEYNWSEYGATLTLSAVSDTAVYFWYKLGGSGKWIKYNEKASSVNNGTFTTMELSFLAEESKIVNGAVIGNVDTTISFKATNYSGDSVEIQEKARVRIDANSPKFDITTTVDGKVVSAEHRVDWQAKEIYIELRPQDEHPSGIIYEYTTVEGGNKHKLPGNGTYFSTDDLITFDGNGAVSIWITAQVRATKLSTTQRIDLKVDKYSPEFNLYGEVTVKDTSNTKTISSGEWVSAAEVTITKKAVVESKSGVTYTYSYSTQPGTNNNWGGDTPALIVKEICVLTVTATSGAGMVVTKTFAVNIDDKAPVINSGVIKNVYKTLDGGKTWIIDKEHAQRYYIDQVITYIEPNLKSAKYNNYPLSNGQIIATNTVDNSNGGYVHIVIEDMAGNKAELVFYMTIFDLTVNNITLGDEDLKLLANFENDFENAKAGLTSSRQAYFSAYISRLNDRIATLRKQINNYQAYLKTINERVSFNLKSDYDEMYTYINYFTTKDTTILYPQWQQDQITANEYGSYYKKLLDEFEKLRLLMATVTKIQHNVAALPATNVVKKTDYPSILRVYNDYEDMTIDQKSVFLSTLYTKLTELKRRCEVLLLQDETSGIKIMGDDLTAGVEIVVQGYDKATDYVNQAQRALLETFPEGLARTIVTVSKISLTGFGAQYDTGEITITLPIPKEYYDYIKFAVYRLATDGTISAVENVTISPDGKTVYFKSNGLDTYILATNANTTVRADTGKIYGSIFGIEIDGKMLTYITFVSVGLFLLLVIILIIVGVKHRWFLKAYNKTYKRSLANRGIKKIPKGNPPPLSNPAAPGEKASYDDPIFKK